MKNRKLTYDQLIKEMRSDARSYNKHLHSEFFDTLGFNGLLAFCHPTYQSDYIAIYKAIKEEEEVK